MKTQKSAAGHFLGTATKGDPYEGDLNAGIGYDIAEVGGQHINVENSPEWIGPYTSRARQIAGHLRDSSIRPCRSILDIGCGTGIATLEVLVANPQARVVA